MGLFLAKEYIKNENLSEVKGIPLHYKDKVHILKKDERFFCVDDDFLEITYTGDELKISYGNKDRLLVNNVNGIISFTVIETSEQSNDRIHLTYPLTMTFSTIRLIKYSETEYDELGGVIMARYLEYRD
jgi:hypothetical protein